jgi:hypothetical protein
MKTGVLFAAVTLAVACLPALADEQSPKAHAGTSRTCICKAKIHPAQPASEEKTVTVTGSNIALKTKNGKVVNSPVKVRVYNDQWLRNQGRGSALGALSTVPGISRGF